MHRWISILVLLTTANCSRPASTQTQPATQEPAQAATPEDEARTIYRDRCAVCHGANGGGDGVGGAALNPRPRSFQDAAWQTATTDDAIERIIREGGAAVGKSPAMPANADLVGRPAIVTALRQRIRGMRQ